MTKYGGIALVLILVTYAIYCVPAALLGSPDVLGMLGISAPGPSSAETVAAGLRTWALSVVGASFIAAFFWWVLGEFVLKVGAGKEGSWIWLWLLFLVLPILASVAASIFGPEVAGNGIIILLFNFGGGIFFYWLSTAMFSPPLVKYIPPRSKQVRLLP